MKRVSVVYTTFLKGSGSGFFKYFIMCPETYERWKGSDPTVGYTGRFQSFLRVSPHVYQAGLSLKHLPAVRTQASIYHNWCAFINVCVSIKPKLTLLIRSSDRVSSEDLIKPITLSLWTLKLDNFSYMYFQMEEQKWWNNIKNVFNFAQRWTMSYGFGTTCWRIELSF